MGDPTPRNELGNARLLRELLARVRRLEQATPLQTAFNDASAAQTTATGAQTTATAAQGVAQGASYDASVAQQQATAAQTTAQQASTDAASASSAASSASQQAQQAQQAVAAKTKTTWSSNVPDNTANPGTADGDTWYVTNGTGGTTTAQYRWSASSSSWTLTPIDGTALRNVIADTVKAGAIDGQVITGPTIKSATSGQRYELVGTQMRFYDPLDRFVAIVSSSASGLLDIASVYGSGGGRIRVGDVAIGSSAKVAGVTLGGNTNINAAYVGSLWSSVFPDVDVLASDGVGPVLKARALYTTKGQRVVFENGNQAVVQAADYQVPNGTSILPVAGSPVNARSGWTVAATRMWVENGYAYIQFAANKSAVLAAGASEAVCDVPAAFIPAAGQYLVPGACYGSTSPAPGLLQISASGTITVFNFGGNHTSFSGIFAHPV